MSDSDIENALLDLKLQTSLDKLALSFGLLPERHKRKKERKQSGAKKAKLTRQPALLVAQPLPEMDAGAAEREPCCQHHDGAAIGRAPVPASPAEGRDRERPAEPRDAARQAAGGGTGQGGGRQTVFMHCTCACSWPHPTLQSPSVRWAAAAAAAGGRGAKGRFQRGAARQGRPSCPNPKCGAQLKGPNSGACQACGITNVRELRRKAEIDKRVLRPALKPGKALKMVAHELLGRRGTLQGAERCPRDAGAKQQDGQAAG